MDDYADLDATALGELVRRGDVKPIELVDAAIARTERLNPALNAVIHRQFERARRDAADAPLDGPFPGVPFLLKDCKAREAGEPYHMGVRTLRDLDFRPRTDSALALRFRSTGLIPIGRTNTPEMALMGTTEPMLYGPTHNPWDLDRSPGGSSGGSAAAVAARIVPAAHANDISGSIRIPAAMCGLVGLKPTRGRALTSDIIDPPVGMNTEGVVSRSVRDTAALVDAITATSPWWPAPPLPGPLVDELARALRTAPDRALDDGVQRCRGRPGMRGRGRDVCSHPRVDGTPRRRGRTTGTRERRAVGSGSPGDGRERSRRGRGVDRPDRPSTR